jgi:hypothetical protein
MKAFIKSAFLMVAGICCGSQKASTSQTASIIPISGQVWQQGEVNPIPLKQVRVKLFGRINTESGSFSRLIAQTRSDARGNYRFVVNDSMPAMQYYLVAQTDKMNVLHPFGKAVFVDKSALLHHYPLEIQQKAWLKLHIKRQQPQAGEKVRLYLGDGELYELTEKSESVWISKPKAGNAYFHYTYGLQQAGKNRFSRLDSVFLTANDTAYMVLRI